MEEVIIEGLTAEESRETMKSIELDHLQKEIASYDYIGIKIAMGVATKEEYAEQIAYTEELRERIRELEGE